MFLYAERGVSSSRLNDRDTNIAEPGFVVGCRLEGAIPKWCTEYNIFLSFFFFVPPVFFVRDDCGPIGIFFNRLFVSK